MVALALLAPLFWSNDGSHVPRIFSGDEPHYLMSIHSVMLDGDLDLANNYAAVHKGSTQAGANFAGTALDHQSVWFESGERRNWEKVYERHPDNFDRDGDGHPVPRLLVGERQPPAGHPEYSQHPMGLALLLAPILYPLRDTAFVEPAAVVCSAVAVIIAFFLFRSLLTKYGVGGRVADLVAMVAFLGTPAWHYARTLFTEPYLLLFAVGAYSFGLRGYPALAGVSIGLGILMKPPFALLLLPLFAMLLAERNLSALIRLSAPVAVSIVVLFCLNHAMFGSPFVAAQAWLQGSVIRGAGGILISPQYGLLMVAPAVLVAFAAWPAFFRQFPRDALVIASGFALYFLLAASWKYWNGATAYAARIVVPVIPLLFVSLVALPKMTLWQWRPARIGMLSICVLSMVINGFAAIAYWQNFDTNPPLRLAQFVAEKFRP
ncbi:hypothetical protein V1281_007365 [Nitrobacteraceae bacterium AZCC 2161]